MEASSSDSTDSRCRTKRTDRQTDHRHAGQRAGLRGARAWRAHEFGKNWARSERPTLETPEFHFRRFIVTRTKRTLQPRGMYMYCRTVL